MKRLPRPRPPFHPRVRSYTLFPSPARTPSHAPDQLHRQRQARNGQRHPRHAAPLGAARHVRAHRHQVRLRHRPVRRLHRPPGRRRDAHLRAARGRRRRQTGDYDRRPLQEPRARRAARVDRGRRAAVRLLPVGADHGRRGAARENSASHRRRHRHGDDQHLPLRHVPAHPRRHPSRRAGSVNMSAPQITRREFLETAGVAGLVIGFHLPATGRQAMRGGAAAAFAPNAWLRIGADESVLVVVDRSEMGQGVTTSLPMLLAEELEADWSKVRIESAPADKAYTNPMFGMQGTGGSTSVRAAYTPLRKAGAAAREMLLSAAAETWGVDKAACRAEKGAVIHTPSNRRLTYGKLVAKAATVPLPHDVPLKDPKDWKILGTRVKRLDTPPKVDGSAQFGIDVKAPGLLVAVVARSPVFGGKVKSFDATNAKAVPGVKHVVQISTGVAVVADGYWSAKKGRDALTVTWDEGPTASVSSASISELFGQKAGQTGAVARHDGDAQGALPGAATKVDAAYELPFLAHATMEPMNCTAHVRADGVDIWAPTQFQTGAQGVGAGIGGVPPEKVRVHTTYRGGGFGRRSSSTSSRRRSRRPRPPARR